MKKYLIYGIFAVFALAMVGCEKEEAVTTKTTTTTKTTQSTTLQIVNLTQYDACVYFDAEFILECEFRNKQTYKIDNEYIGNPIYVEVVYFDNELHGVGKVYWESVRFKSGHKYKMTLTGKVDTSKLEQIE